MKRLFILMIAALALSCGSCTAVGTAQAKEKSIASRGGIVYQQDGMEVALYAEDLLLLRDKLSTIPEDTFDPKSYASTAQQKATCESAFVNMVETDQKIRCGIGETGSAQGYESVEEEQVKTEIKENTEIPAQTETEDDPAPADPSEVNSPENEDTEDISASTDPPKENPQESEDAEDVSDSTNPSEENSKESEDAENVSAPADLHEANTPESEDAEDGSALDKMLTENLQEMKIRDDEEQIITE